MSEMRRAVDIRPRDGHQDPFGHVRSIQCAVPPVFAIYEGVMGATFKYIQRLRVVSPFGLRAGHEPVDASSRRAGRIDNGLDE